MLSFSQNGVIGGKMSRKLLILVVLIMVGVIGGGLAYWSHTSGVLPKAEPGSLVEVNWTARDEQGTVVETNIREVAESCNLPLRAEPFYKTLRFEVGKGPVKGIDEGVLGMRVGQEKTVKISPEKGFAGVRTLAWIEQEEKLPTLESFSREELEKRLGIEISGLGQVLPHYLGGWRVVITELTPEEVTFSSPGLVTSFSWQMFPGWNVTVLEVTPEQIVLRHEPEVGLRFKAQEGGFPFLEPLTYEVRQVTGQQIGLAYNPYESLAGKSLEITLTVVGLEKPEAVKES
jgi:FKBP-type peptidyl-prolyl cis-trans isomerase 2